MKRKTVIMQKMGKWENGKMGREKCPAKGRQRKKGQTVKDVEATMLASPQIGSGWQETELEPESMMRKKCK